MMYEPILAVYKFLTEILANDHPELGRISVPQLLGIVWDDKLLK